MARHPTAVWIPSPNTGYPRGTHGQVFPLAKVVHIAAGTLAGMDSWFSNPNSSASAHFGIGKNGALHQYADTLDACWHAGIMNRPDRTIPIIDNWFRTGKNPNLFTIGIENEGQSGDIPTPAQWETLIDLTIWLDETHPSLGDTLGEHLTHSQIDSVNRSGDPGTGYNIKTIFEENHMALTEDQKKNIQVAELLPDLIAMEAVLVRMGLRVSGAFSTLEKVKRDGIPAMRELKGQISGLKSQEDYVKFVQAASSLESKLNFFGA